VKKGGKMPDIEEAVLMYAAAFSENDSAERRRLIETCFAEDGTVTAEHIVVAGREALLTHIAAFRETAPDDRAVLTSGIQQHHNWFRFSAEVVRPDGSRYSEALDVGEVGPDGRITRIVTFFGPPPPPPQDERQESS
jgi:hypothetical protein